MLVRFIRRDRNFRDGCASITARDDVILGEGMKIPFLSAVAFLVLAAGVWIRPAESASASDARTPVLVELFTSEGCSSCPPADAYLQELDRQPVAGEEMIVLSEHVDYWNHIGWKDPYSARLYSDRQSAYASRFGLSSVYTPQIVVDGITEFVGSDRALAEKAFTKASRAPKIAVHLSSVSLDAAGTLQAHLETGPLQQSFGLQAADVYVAVALDHAESEVSRGENAGRTLTHTAVVRSIVKAGTFIQGHSFAQEVQLKLSSGYNPRNLRVVAFVQEPRQGRVIGSALQLVSNTVPGEK